MVGRILAILVLLAACSGGPGEPDATPPVDQRCIDADEHSDLEWIQDNIFSRTCSAFNSCHKGNATSAGNLNLEEGMTFDMVVDQPSDVFTGLDIVEPGKPEESFMLVILGHYGEDDPRIDPEVGTMPFNNQPICEPKRLAIERWILSLDDAIQDAGPDAALFDAGPDAML